MYIILSIYQSNLEFIDESKNTSKLIDVLPLNFDVLFLI